MEKSKAEIFNEIILSKCSNVCESEKSELDLITEEILQLKRNMVENTIVLGIKLRQVKENLGHGEWLPWLETQVDFSPRTAQKFIKIATEYENTNTKATAYLGSEKLYILLDLPREQREDFLENNNVEIMSTRELTKRVKEIKDAKKAEKKAAKETKVIEAETIENKTIVDTEKIIKKVDNLIKEIKIRTGSFYCDKNFQDDVKCDDRGGIIAQLYALGEITEDELVETVKTYNIDLEINFKELLKGTLKGNYYNNICNSYTHYYNNENYLDVVESRNLSYENTNDFSGWCDDETKGDFIKNYKVEEGKLSILVGYNENGDSNLCFYKDKKLIGHYLLGDKWSPLDKKDIKELLKDVNKLAKLEKIELESLYSQWVEQYKGYFAREQKRQEVESKERTRKLNYEEKKREFDEKYNGKTTYKFEEIYDEDCSIKNWEKYKDNNKQYLDYLTRESEAYKNYDWGNFGSSNTLAVIKEEDKPYYKKFYKTLAINFHPDKVGGDGREMQIINDLKKSWGL